MSQIERDELSLIASVNWGENRVKISILGQFASATKKSDLRRLRLRSIAARLAPHSHRTTISALCSSAREATGSCSSRLFRFQNRKTVTGRPMVAGALTLVANR